ncbi:guanylate kinase [Pectobacterium carotovorum]|uniref:guanylate kinase n=1 Tax=Pectobacterium carotovorum TaxID=554 RepID=UPI002B054FFA|nr:hypothetical protein [Pectobacterium carotovorum]
MCNKLFLIISGPSGAGKNTCIKKIIEECSNVQFITPFTTRPKRHDEVSDKDYHFITYEYFSERYKSGEILDWDYTLNNYYGFFKNDLENTANILITHALAKMALRIKSILGKKVITIFIEPVDDKEIQNRILHRDNDTTDLASRVQHGRDELIHKELFDYKFLSENSDETSKNIINLFQEIYKTNS